MWYKAEVAREMAEINEGNVSKILSTIQNFRNPSVSQRLVFA